MLGTAALFMLQCRTWSNEEVVLGPSSDMWGLSTESVMPSNGAILWHTHGKGFNDHFLHLVMWFVNIVEILGCPERITRVCNWSRVCMSDEIGRVFKKEDKRVRILFFRVLHNFVF